MATILTGCVSSQPSESVKPRPATGPGASRGTVPLGKDPFTVTIDGGRVIVPPSRLHIVDVDVIVSDTFENVGYGNVLSPAQIRDIAALRLIRGLRGSNPSGDIKVRVTVGLQKLQGAGVSGPRHSLLGWAEVQVIASDEMSGRRMFADGLSPVILKESGSTERVFAEEIGQMASGLARRIKTRIYK